jgi:hypothetical protein
MKSYLTIVGILIIGFVCYFLSKDYIFDPRDDGFLAPAKASLIPSQPVVYPERTVTSSGPNAPSQSAPSNEIVIHDQPVPTDPYQESHDTPDSPETMRYPERSFRPTPLNNNTSMSVDAGLSSSKKQVSADNSQQYDNEFIQSGGEFMPGIFANDTYNDVSYSAF